MALSLTDFENRIDRSLKLLGTMSAASKTDNICDGVSEFVKQMDLPLITDTIAVNTTTKRYSVPATINFLKIQDVRKADLVTSVNFVLDATTQEIVLQDLPGEAANYTVYGTPEDVETNLSTIIAAISTNYKRELWAYIKWACYEWANEDTANAKLTEAIELGRRARKSNNMSLALDFVTNQNKDTTGKRIAQDANAEGFPADIDDFLKDDI